MRWLLFAHKEDPAPHEDVSALAVVVHGRLPKVAAGPLAARPAPLGNAASWGPDDDQGDHGGGNDEAGVSPEGAPEAVATRLWKSSLWERDWMRRHS